MARPVKNIAQLMLETTSGKTRERTFSTSNKFYSSKTCNKGIIPDRGCMPWETCLEQKCPRRSTECCCPATRERRIKLRPECELPESCTLAATKGLLFHPDDTDFDVPNYDAKTYPMMQGKLKRAVPGAPMPGWEAIQKIVPKKPEGC